MRPGCGGACRAPGHIGRAEAGLRWGMPCARGGAWTAGHAAARAGTADNGGDTHAAHRFILHTDNRQVERGLTGLTKAQCYTFHTVYGASVVLVCGVLSVVYATST